MKLSRPMKTVGYFTNQQHLAAVQVLESIFNGTALQEAQTQGPPEHSQSDAPLDKALTLSVAEKQVLNVSFPYDFATKSLGGYRFKNQDLLVRALLHPKYKARQRKQMKTTFEPLDYIGNFVLDFVVSRHILRNGSNKSKAQMHGIRAQLLCQRSCAYFAAHNGFQDYVLIDEGREKSEMFNYAQNAKNAGVVEQVNGSSFLHKFFKSVAGAIYVDSGYNPDVVENVYYGFMKADMDRLLSR
ncbi:ribonuclease 3-like isoform X2 [Ornithodoros turicata]